MHNFISSEYTSLTDSIGQRLPVHIVMLLYYCVVCCFMLVLINNNANDTDGGVNLAFLTVNWNSKTLFLLQTNSELDVILGRYFIFIRKCQE